MNVLAAHLDPEANTPSFSDHSDATQKGFSTQGKTAHAPVMEQGPSTRARGKQKAAQSPATPEQGPSTHTLEKQKATQSPAMDKPGQGTSSLSQITDEPEQERYRLVFFHKSMRTGIIISPTALVRELQQLILHAIPHGESNNNGGRLTFWKVCRVTCVISM